jgi:hypothetical protein
MFLPFVLLLLQPQIAPKFPAPIETAELTTATELSAGASDIVDGEDSAPNVEVASAADAMPVPAEETSGALPDAPVPLEPVEVNAPVAFLNPAKQMKVSVDQLVAENRRKQMVWKGLAIATSGAATFDAWTTRHAITTTGAVELNPLLKPFAGNSSLYAAIQVGPALLDFAGKKMMYSHISWVRRMWWVPQSASFVSSMFCGSHNLAFH